MRLTLTQEAHDVFYVHLGSDTGQIIAIFSDVRSAVDFMREYQS